MRIYWYWPFLRSEDIGLAESVAVDPVEHLLVHTLDRPGVPRTAANERVELRNDLPEVAAIRTGTPAWAVDRARTYSARRRRRADVVDAGPDLTHVWFLNRFTDVVDVPRLASQGPLVVNVHDVRPHNRRLPDAVGDRLLRRIYRSDACLVVHHEALRDRLTTEFGVDGSRVVVVPHMVRARPRPPDGPIARRGDRVLFFGTLRHNKGLEVLLDAIESADPAIRWEIIGRGEPDLEAVVSAAARRLPALDATIGHASEADKAAAFDRADVVVMPYTAFESQSGVLHDAYAHGVPVVVTDVGALGPTVRDDGTGTVIDAGDPAAVHDAVTALLADDEARAAARSAAARIAAERAPARIAALLHSLYTDLV